MSEIDVSYNESATTKEDENLVSRLERQKHASSTEKDDANLLSEGTSEEEDVEDDLVLTYSDSTKAAGEFQESVAFENGQSLSASEDEISASTEDQLAYSDSKAKVGKLLSIESEESPRAADPDVKIESSAKTPEPVAEDVEISRIAETLSAKTDLNRSPQSAMPGKPVPAADTPGNHTSSSKLTTKPTKQRTSSSSSLSDSGRFSTGRKNGQGSSDHSSGGELEWDEEYEFGHRRAGMKAAKKTTVDEATKRRSQGEVAMLPQSQGVLPPSDIEYKDIAVDSEEVIRESTIGSDSPTRPLSRTDEQQSLETNAKKISEPTHELKNRQAKEHKRRSANGKQKKEKKAGKRTRYKIYLDDPDIHQCIADFSGVLRTFAREVEKGKFVPKSESRLHPISRDDVSTGVKKKGGSKKQMVTKSTSMDQPQGTKTPAPIQQSKSAGNLGPYDGHGKRGRNLIARIKGLSESSSSSEDDEEDEDELTNARINTSRVRKTNSNTKPRKEEKVYDYCAECGQVHTADEETTEETDHDICPDCGVPHNPFQHPPSPSSKDPPEPKREEILPSIEGPHTTDELRGGARYKMKYLGTTQVLSQHPVTKETRMEQAREAFARIKVPDGEVQPATDVDIVISLERIKVLNCEGKHEDVMMDHALRTVCFICDMGDILVLMSRRLTTDLPDLSLDKQGSVSLSKLLAEREQRTSKNICHIFQCEEAQTISKAIGQAFNMAYRQFLKSNGISHDNVEEAEYCHVLESQKIVGQDLDLLADSSNTRDIVIQKKRGEALGIMLLESGWGSMLPTVFVAHIAIYSPSARLGGSLSVGDHILACNGASLVGLPLSECNQILRNTRSSARVILKIVSCPPVVDVVVSRPDVKYQLGFSVQNGTICSLLRGGIAERGGVRVGHRIIEINGESVVAKSHQHIVDILATTSGDISMKTLPVAMYRLMVGIDTPTHV